MNNPPANSQRYNLPAVPVLAKPQSCVCQTCGCDLPCEAHSIAIRAKENQALADVAKNYKGLKRREARLIEFLWQSTTEECRERMKIEFPNAIKATEKALGHKLRIA